MKNLQIFTYSEKPIRVIEKENAPWWVLSDVCNVLGLTNASRVAERLDDDEKQRIKFNSNLELGLGHNGATIINESGLYKVILRSDKEEAKKFTRWVTHEVLPAIRKTGSYNVKSELNDAKLKRLEIMDRNSRTRAAKLLLKIGERTTIPEYKEVCNAKAAAMVTGKDLLPLPSADKKTYSAGEIGKMFGVSANKIGRIAAEHKLKTPEYGKLFYSKSEYSSKEVETWRYYDTVIRVLEGILGRKAVAA